MNALRLFRLWCGFSAFAAIGIVLSILFFDAPVANYSKREIHLTGLLASPPSSLQIAVVLSVICVLIGIFCVLTRRFPKWAEAIPLSIVTAALSLGLAILIFKPLFGRPDPQMFVFHLRSNFGWHSQALAS